jgi:hypothetical protein
VQLHLTLAGSRDVALVAREPDRLDLTRTGALRMTQPSRGGPQAGVDTAEAVLVATGAVDCLVSTPVRTAEVRSRLGYVSHLTAPLLSGGGERTATSAPTRMEVGIGRVSGDHGPQLGT